MSKIDMAERILGGLGVEHEHRLKIERDGPAMSPWRVKSAQGAAIWIPTAGGAKVCLSFKTKAEAIDLVCGMAGQWLMGDD